MSNNLFANVPAAIFAKNTKSWAAAGVTEENTRIIHSIGIAPTSYDPSEDLNSMTGMIQGEDYYIIPKVDWDMSADVYPPIPVESPNEPDPTPKAYKFTTGNADQVIHFPSTNAFNFPSNHPFTLQGQFMILTGGTLYLSKGTATTRSFDFLVAVYGGNLASQFQVTSGDGTSGSPYILANGSVLTYNTIHVFSCVFDGSSVKIYINGALASTQSANGTFGTMPETGALQFGNVVTAFCNDSQIYDVQLVNKAINATEALEHKNATQNGSYDPLELSYAADIIESWLFDESLNGQKNAHNGLATTPVYV